MKAILEFDLPEDKYDFDIAVNSNKYVNIIDDLDTELRAINKYGATQLYGQPFKDTHELVELIREHIYIDEA